MYDTIVLTIHQEGGHQKGAGAFGGRPFLVESVAVDGEKYGVIRIWCHISYLISHQLYVFADCLSRVVVVGFCCETKSFDKLL